MTCRLERLDPRLPREAACLIGAELSCEHRQPTAEVVATKIAKPTHVVLEQDDPEVAEDVVDLVIREFPRQRTSFADRIAQAALVRCDQLAPSTRITREGARKQLIVRAHWFAFLRLSSHRRENLAAQVRNRLMGLELKQLSLGLGQCVLWQVRH
jgi:hypothetical protein